jgi:hypothetical protein
MHRSPFGKVAREHSPLAAGFEDIQQGAECIIQINGSGFGLLFGRFKDGQDLRKLFPSDVARVFFPVHFFVFVLLKPL